jgi:membrane glycosyltransferase
MLFFSPGFFIWLSPVTVGLALSIPLSVWTSRISLGRAARKMGLFLTPPETTPPREIFDYQKGLKKQSIEDTSRFAIKSQGFARAVVHPATLALHLKLAETKRHSFPAHDERLAKLVEKALAKGPETLSSKEKHALLNAPKCMQQLHEKVWSLDKGKAAKWGLP